MGVSQSYAGPELNVECGTDGCTAGCGGYFGVCHGSDPVSLEIADPSLPSCEGFEQLVAASSETSTAAYTLLRIDRVSTQK